MIKLIITSGDPAGIGPEVTLKALNSFGLNDVSIVVLGDPSLYSVISKKLGVPFNWKIIEYPQLAEGGVNLLPVEPGGFSLCVSGNPDKKTSEAAFNYLKKSAELLKKDFDGVVTAPISKEKLWDIGFRYPGHTEFYADLFGVKDFVMMLGGDRLKVSLVTIHIPLRRVPEEVTPEKVEMTIRVTHREFIGSFGVNDPLIAVAGLNPHAGEGGKMGDEEVKVIIPAIEKLKKEGINVVGPFPPDTLFYRAVKEKFDVVVSMYHDQGLIPLKLLHFDDAVNVTLGLPKVRTSVDHGTAYDIAPLFRANHNSMISAIKTAIMMIRNRKKYEIHQDKRGKGA